jgi:hypothetical protein
MSFNAKSTPRVEQFEPRFLLSGSPPFHDLLSSAAVVDVVPSGSVCVQDEIAQPGQACWYQFTAPASGRMGVEMQADGSGIDTYLSIHDTRGRRIERNDNVGRGRTDSRISLRVSEGRTYYVMAVGTKNTTGAFTLRLTSTPTDDYGNAIETAKAWQISSSGSGGICGRINYADDVDVFALVATKSGLMTADMKKSATNGPLDCELFAYNSARDLVAYNNDAVGTDARVTFNVVAGQTYYLKTSSFDASTGKYRLSVSTADPLPAPDPPPPPPPPPVPDPEPVPPPAPGPTPGESIVAQILSLAGGLQLQVLGTNATDAITISQTVESIVLTTAVGSTSYAGVFASVLLYGFGGADTIRLTNTVTAAAEIYGGDGADMIFDAGTGAAKLCGGAGDDLLVGVGGGADLLYGQDGLDSFWFDASDSASDADSAETAAKSIHRISQFYQPYTTDPSSPSYVSLEIAGQNFTDPTASYAYRSFASTPLFVDGPQYDDIAQGAVGDCYYLAALASLADTDPNIIQQMVAPMGDGTFAVRFYSGGSEVYLRLDADLPASGSSPAYAKLGKDGELWVPIVEKAYAYFRYGQNSYSSISGGWMSAVYTQVANCASPWRYTTGTAADLYNYIASNLAGGHPVTMGSYSNASGPIVGGHAYMVKSVATSESGSYVTVYNPWGYDGRTWDSTPSDGLLTLSIAQVQQYFQAVAVGLV